MYEIKILIAEDEENLRTMTCKYLKREGFTVIEAADGKSAYDLWCENNIDLVIMDIMMPFIDGWEICRRIRKQSDVPIIMLTARTQEEDKIHGFELGTDQYVEKPFSNKELITRVKSLLKKRRLISSNTKINLGNIIIDTDARQVVCDNTYIELTPKEYNMLLYLVNNINIVLSREQLLNRVWGYDCVVEDRAVDTVIKRIRQKLGNFGSYIITVRGTGYMLEVKK